MHLIGKTSKLIVGDPNMKKNGSMKILLLLSDSQFHGTYHWKTLLISS